MSPRPAVRFREGLWQVVLGDTVIASFHNWSDAIEHVSVWSVDDVRRRVLFLCGGAA